MHFYGFHYKVATKGCDMVWVIINRLAESAHFYLWMLLILYLIMLEFILDEVVTLQGVLLAIISDSEAQFVV